ncbi:hypothetical protein HMPREF9148_01959 [Prevotella sp. F0091]|nr:hypothetical protein HMPREF9148_01959 [Prevotella sp. F0091]
MFQITIGKKFVNRAIYLFSLSIVWRMAMGIFHWEEFTKCLSKKVSDLFG